MEYDDDNLYSLLTRDDYRYLVYYGGQGYHPWHQGYGGYGHPGGWGPWLSWEI